MACFGDLNLLTGDNICEGIRSAIKREWMLYTVTNVGLISQNMVNITALVFISDEKKNPVHGPAASTR